MMASIAARTVRPLKSTSSTSQTGHPCPQPVAGLPEVGGSRITVHLRIDFPNSRQWMHQERMLWQATHDVGGYDIYPSISLVHLRGFESLHLDSRLIKDIEGRDDG